MRRRSIIYKLYNKDEEEEHENYVESEEDNASKQTNSIFNIQSSLNLKMFEVHNYYKYKIIIHN